MKQSTLPGDVAAIVNAARALFNSGDAVGAERLISPLIDQLRSDPASMHLMGLIKRTQNHFEEAELWFRRAISHSFSEGAYYNDLGVMLQAREAYDEALKCFRAALALTPQSMTTRVNIVRCLIGAGNLAEAERETQAYIAAAPGPESWTLLGQVQRAQDRNEDALVSAETALKYAPSMRSLRNTYGMALDRLGRGKEALEVYESLGRESLDSAELALNFGRALYSEGRVKDAEAILERGVTSWPANVTLQSNLARVRALRGEGENAVALMEAEIRKRPTDLSLRFACADALHRAHLPQKALSVLSEAVQLAPDTPALLTALGIVLDELDRPLDGLRALRRVADLEPQSPVARRNLLSTLIRAGRADEALFTARALRQAEPDDQFLIANEAVAMRVLGDPAYRTLYDYDRLVRVYEIPPPRGFFTAQNFNASLAEVLRREHKSNAHPLDQYMHNGSQTGRSLLTASEPTLAAFMAAVEGSVRDYVSRLQPNASDPVGRRRTEKVRYASLWSARLTNQGYQPNHVHDRGWISSAYYVSVLPNEKLRDPHAGHLKFGEPNRPAAGCGPEKFIEPEVGKLVLFPSYMWHGTVPFEGAERLSLSFDVLPA